MTDELAKLQLKNATNPEERRAAIRAAMSAGMPLHAIRDYLDWLDNTPAVEPEPPKVEPTHSNNVTRTTRNRPRADH